ncbi:hypothetical protein GGH95_006327, partial [Coemansia sp. RSA 1836]
MSFRLLAAKHNVARVLSLSSSSSSSARGAASVRYASILGPEHHHHHHRPRSPPLRSPATTTTTRAPSATSQQQQQTMTSTTTQQPTHRQVNIGSLAPRTSSTSSPHYPPRGNIPPSNQYIFRHRGMVPSEPQSINSLQFILNQKPLGATAVVPGSGKKDDDAAGARLLMLSSSSPSVAAAAADCQSNGMEVRTAEEAREKARMKLEELNDIVQSASGLVGALSVAAKRHLSAASAAAADVSSPSSVLPSLQLP